MTASILLPALISFSVSALLGPVVIPFLRKLKAMQTVREEGPVTHRRKNGTPTMGGILFLAGVFVSCRLFAGQYPKIIPVVFLTLGFGLVGLLDDYIKVILHRSMGLTALQKFSAQLLVTGIFAYYLTHYAQTELLMKIPFLPGRLLDIGVWSIPLLFLVVIGTVNGTNFTDGLDGLAGSVTVLVAVFFSVAAIGTKSGIEPATCAVAGGLLGFLLFNVYPASVFMGDTGSLALGGFVAGTAYALQMPLFIPIVGFVYLAEVLSVMLQVVCFKLTGGKRLFKMAPLHHHFELCGWSETRVVAVFSIVTALLCLIGLAAV
ncbi:MAG: phospho-N-acetylmuramoyl-pentapeptide-transferase [Eisenbergiella sp.]